LLLGRGIVARAVVFVVGGAVGGEGVGVVGGGGVCADADAGAGGGDEDGGGGVASSRGCFLVFLTDVNIHPMPSTNRALSLRRYH
jgi:hypothetical protein